MSRRPWYKRFAGDFIAGTLALTLEEKGAYSMVLDMIYDRGEAIPDDPQWIARVCGCSTRKWKQIREKLIEVGKLWEAEGRLFNKRAEKQITSEEKEHDLLVESGTKGGLKTAENKYNDNSNNDIAGNALPQVEQHTRSQKPYPKEEDISVDFLEWWKASPKRIGRGQAVKAYRLARKKADAPALLAAIKVYAATVVDADQKYTASPATWLNGERWLDEIPAPEPPEARMTYNQDFADREHGRLLRAAGFMSKDFEAATGIKVMDSKRSDIDGFIRQRKEAA